TKITIRVEWADGTVNEMEAVEPDKVSFESNFASGQPTTGKPTQESVHIVPSLGRAVQIRNYAQQG
ncbi:MAG TPA: hypothetical protein VHW01_16795, partial [Polyangiaceae bacterium]|nr:hypothetical protein [Polyangiaceae bacterium]